METITKKRLDGRGKTITPFVVFEAAAELETMLEGEELEILTDEFEPFEWDITAWTQATGHLLRTSQPVPGGHRFVVVKGAPRTKDAPTSSSTSEEPEPTRQPTRRTPPLSGAAEQRTRASGTESRFPSTDTSALAATIRVTSPPKRRETR